MGIFSARRKRAALGKKASIADALVDFWAYILFVVIIIIFFFLFKISQTTKLQSLEDAKDVTYGNYLASVYLRTPLDVGGTKMTIADLISLYDYNQSFENTKDITVRDQGVWMVTTSPLWIFGKDNTMREALITLTDEFIRANFDKKKCFVFAIHGNHFDYNYFSTGCPASQGFSMKYLLAYLPSVPAATFVTYIAPVDPRESPIMLFSIYDFERLLALYSPDPYFDMTDAQRAAIGAQCTMNLAMHLFSSECTSKDAVASGQAAKQVADS